MASGEEGGLFFWRETGNRLCRLTLVSWLSTVPIVPVVSNWYRSDLLSFQSVLCCS